MEPIRDDIDVDALHRRIEELERTQRERDAELAERDAELATARALLAATWPGKNIPTEPVPAELSHALRGPRQTVRLVVDGRPVYVGVRAKKPPDMARELDAWSAVLRFARGRRG